MSDRAALIATICANPDDDTARLVYADWLEDHADAFPAPVGVRQWAAFIRDDIAMSRRDEFDPVRLRWEWVEKPRREAEPWVKETQPPLPDMYEWTQRPLLRRGFISGVTLDLKGRLNVPELPLGAFPVEHVRFFNCTTQGVEWLQQMPRRNQLGTVEFVRSGFTSSNDFRRLFTLDGLDRLERLGFYQHTIDRRVLERVTTSRIFSRLASFTMTDTPVGVPFVEALSRLGSPIPLKELHLSGCRMTPGAVTTLLDSPAAGNLQSLSLGGDRIGAPEKFRRLGEASNPPPIRSLDMSNDSPSEEGLEAFLGSPIVPQLQRLAISECSLNRQRTGLLATGQFENLRVLELDANSIGNYGAVAIARSPYLAGLFVLILNSSQVGDEGIEAILESPLADTLVLLDLRNSPASEEMKEVLKARMGDRVRLDDSV